jgi:hypothetical protein
MFRDQTVFVLGAGSNLEHGFMLGAELKEQISQRLRATQTKNVLKLPEFLREVSQSQAWVQEKLGDVAAIRAANKITSGLGGKDSIDDFLDVHIDDLAVNSLGKFTIVDAVLAAERASKLAYDGQYHEVDEIALKQGAYLYLWKNLTRNLRATELATLNDRTKTPLKIVTFNYDRSLEQFLFRALAQTYHLDADRAARIVRGLDIVHVYGSAGEWGYGRHDSASRCRMGSPAIC